MFKKLVDKQKIFIDRWAKENLAGLFVFNIIILLLVLLRFAGYFSPFLEININLIYLISLILSVVMLKATSRMMFVVAFAFWLLLSF